MICYYSFIIFIDLSFNNIEVMEGLENLTKLTDVTLYNNRISRIENMDTLIKLHVFSIGNNNLKELENASYLCIVYRQYDLIINIEIGEGMFFSFRKHYKIGSM